MQQNNVTQRNPALLQRYPAATQIRFLPDPNPWKASRNGVKSGKNIPIFVTADGEHLLYLYIYKFHDAVTYICLLQEQYVLAI